MANSKRSFQIISQKKVFQGFFKVNEYTLTHSLFNGGNSSIIKRELFERGAAVGVIGVDFNEDCILLVEQIRIGALIGDAESPWLIEPIAGMLESDESPEEVARREAVEEAQCQLKRMKLIHKYWVSPGGTDEFVYLFCAEMDSKVVGEYGGLEVEHEDIKIHKIPFKTAYCNLDAGHYNNAMAIIGLQWLRLNEETLKKEWS